MAKLYFYYASMNAGKSTTLLQADFNYRERGMRTMLWTGAIDARVIAGRLATGRIVSRLELEREANLFDVDTDLRTAVLDDHALHPLACVLIDEAQWLTRAQVLGLARLCDENGVPVLAYGLRTDFRGELFPGSAALLGLADALIELKSVCGCGRKATMNLRVDEAGRAVTSGEQIEVGGNERYEALCRRHFMERSRGRGTGTLSQGSLEAS